MDTPEKEFSLPELFRQNGLSLDDCVRFPDEGEHDEDKIAAQKTYLQALIGKRKLEARQLEKHIFSTRDTVFDKISQGEATVPFYVHAEAQYSLLREGDKSIGGLAQLAFEHTFPEGFLTEDAFEQFLLKLDCSGFQGAYEKLIEVGRMDPEELPKWALGSKMSVLWLKKSYLEKLQPKAEYTS